MPWVTVKSAHLRSLRYDEKLLRLDLKLTDGRVVSYANVLPHVYENMVDENCDVDFYYQYYVQQGDIVGHGRTRAALSYAAKLACVLVVAWLLSATSASYEGEHTAFRASVSDARVKIN